MLSPKDSPVGKQLLQYVCARIIRMDNVNLGLFDYDRNNTLFYFIMNADQQIYMRYGGRDSESQDTYLNLSSLELALKQGLELHRRHTSGELKPAPAPAPVFAKDMPLLMERTIGNGRCVECHLIGDFQNLQREKNGALDKVAHLYRSPDLKTIGIQLDVPKGLLVAQAGGAAQAAGMQPGDRISAINGVTVWTFGDLQYQYDKVDRKADHIQLTVDRAGKSVDLALTLPPLWWWTDVRWRQSSVDPRLYFEARPLTESQKRELQLKPGGFASTVKSVDSFAQMTKSHELKVGDIVYAVDGVEQDDVATNVELYIKLRKTPGDTVTLDVIRGGQRMKMPLRTYRMSFRK